MILLITAEHRGKKRFPSSTVMCHYRLISVECGRAFRIQKTNQKIEKYGILQCFLDMAVDSTYLIQTEGSQLHDESATEV